MWGKRKTEKRNVWRRIEFVLGSRRTQKKKRKKIFVAGKSLTGQGEEGK